MLSALLLALTLVAFSPSERPTHDLVQTHLDVDLHLDYAARAIAGTACLTIQNQGQAPVAAVPIQLGRLMEVGAIADGSGRAIAFTQDVVRYPDWPVRQVLAVEVTLPAPLRPSERMTLQVDYKGILIGYAETGTRYVHDRVDRDFTVLRTDAYAFPTLGEPSLAALRSQRREDFTFDAKLHIPDNELIAATGVPGERVATDDGAVWTFTSSEPVPFLNLTIAPYSVLEGEGVQVFHFAEDREGAERLRQAAESALDRYTEWFGTLGEVRPISILEIPDGWGSQSSLTGGILQEADAFRSGAAVGELFHELAHLWHPAELDRPADRWNEGFATFLAWRMEEAWGSGDALDDRAEALAVQLAEQYEDPAGRVPMSEFGERSLTGRSYKVGALLYYILFRSLGAEAFDRHTAAFFAAYRDGGATNTEWAEALAGSAEVDVARIVQEWATSTVWLDRLDRGDTLTEIAAAYRHGKH